MVRSAGPSVVDGAAAAAAATQPRPGQARGTDRQRPRQPSRSASASPSAAMTADDLSQLAAAPRRRPRRLRLTPWRAILVPVASERQTRALVSALTPGNFILDRDDPRRRVAACSGAPACARATTPDPRGRHALFGNARRHGPSTTASSLHVSGCAKGCAHPRPRARDAGRRATAAMTWCATARPARQPVARRLDAAPDAAAASRTVS